MGKDVITIGTVGYGYGAFLHPIQTWQVFPGAAQ